MGAGAGGAAVGGSSGATALAAPAGPNTGGLMSMLGMTPAANPADLGGMNPDLMPQNQPGAAPSPLGGLVMPSEEKRKEFFKQLGKQEQPQQAPTVAPMPAGYQGMQPSQLQQYLAAMRPNIGPMG